jgi:hypothetical protein
MRYAVERRLTYSPLVVWNALRDLRHFAENDPYHHDFRWVGDRREGVGAEFVLGHSYAPLFPFGPDEVTCRVTEWEPGERQTIVETNRRAYRSHWQRFTLIHDRYDTMIRFEIGYRGIPWLLLPWRLWVGFMVTRRMRQKLADIEKRCRGMASGSHAMN